MSSSPGKIIFGAPVHSGPLQQQQLTHAGAASMSTPMKQPHAVGSPLMPSHAGSPQHPLAASPGRMAPITNASSPQHPLLASPGRMGHPAILNQSSSPNINSFQGTSQSPSKVNQFPDSSTNSNVKRSLYISSFSFSSFS